MKGLYAWQSILKTRRVVRLGSRWRIGDGKSVMIHGDKWLPDLHSSRVISPQKIVPNNTLMCALIDEEKCRWIEDWVLEEFLPHEAEITLRLPLSSTRAKDKLIWTATKNGCYSTKSAYHLLSDEAVASIPGPSNPTDHKQFWLETWSLNVSNKIWHFILLYCEHPTILFWQKWNCWKGISRLTLSVSIAVVIPKIPSMQSGVRDGAVHWLVGQWPPHFF